MAVNTPERVVSLFRGFALVLCAWRQSDKAELRLNVDIPTFGPYEAYSVLVYVSNRENRGLLNLHWHAGTVLSQLDTEHHSELRSMRVLSTVQTLHNNRLSFSGWHVLT